MKKATQYEERMCVPSLAAVVLENRSSQLMWESFKNGLNFLRYAGENEFVLLFGSNQFHTLIPQMLQSCRNINLLYSLVYTVENHIQ